MKNLNLLRGDFFPRLHECVIFSSFYAQQWVITHFFNNKYNNIFQCNYNIHSTLKDVVSIHNNLSGYIYCQANLNSDSLEKSA